MEMFFKFPHDVYSVINPFRKSGGSLPRYNIQLPRKTRTYLIFNIFNMNYHTNENILILHRYFTAPCVEKLLFMNAILK